MLDDEAQARRLARAICSDVLLYNGAVKDAPREQRAGLLAEPLHEGRALFTARVAPSLLFIFDQTVEELIARPMEVDLRTLSATPAPTPAPASRPLPPSLGAPVTEAKSSVPLAVAAVVLLALAAAVAFVLFR